MLRLLAVLALVAQAPMLHAAELGDVAARSYIGQPLSADVELLPGDGGPVQARLAQLDVYRGANITMNPALASVKMAVVRRDGKDVLHISTAGAVNADYVHVYVELTAGGRRDIRLATVWLQPDPNPAPPPVRVAPAVSVPAVVAAAEPAKVADSAAPAAAARLVRDRTRPAPMPSIHESEVGGPGGLKAAAAQARPPSLVPVRDIPERISEALGSRVIAPAKTAEKPAPRAAGTPVSSAAAVADKPRSVAAETPLPQVAGRPVGNGATKPADKPAGAGDPKLTDKRAGAGTPQPPGKPAVIGAPELAEAPAGAGPHKSAGKPAAGLASKSDTRHGVKPETVVAGPGASQLAITATAAPPPQVAQALLPMPPLPLPAGVKKMAAPAACAPTGASAKECRALDLQSQALSTKLVELEGKVKQLQSALAGSTGAAAAAQVAKQATPAAPGAKPAAPAAATKPLTIASGMSDARAATADVPVAAKQPATPGAAKRAAAPDSSDEAATPDAQGGAKQAATPGTPVAEKHSAPTEAPKTEAATAKAATAESTTAEATAAEAAAPPPAPVQQRRVLPKLKYKKEKPPEEQSSKLPLIAGGVGLALLAGAGALFYLRRKKSGAPLKIWQGFRKKQGPADAAGDDFREVPTPKSAVPEPAVQP
ncbi:hypothetical protein F8197_24655 [Duganella sp. FT27W]|nr:hypothetical protein [Duganella sp. FT27W]